MPRTGKALLALVAILSSCSLTGTGIDGDEGSIEITLHDATARTLLPPIDMTPASFEILGTGPAGKSFSRSTSSPSVVVSKLAFGTWTVTVSAMNAGNAVIGRGTGLATVVTGQQTSLAVTVTPVAGTGSFDLRVTWIAADVPNPSIEAQLLPSSGPAIALAGSMASGSSSCLKAGIPNGYYTLLLKLFDNGVLVMGAVEIVRIVAGQTTTGTFDFTRVNKGVGSIAVSITPRTSDPIAVTMTGQSATLATGASMTVTAAVPANVGNVAYVWYLNGESKAVGATGNPGFAFGSTLEAGYYRLDVTAFTADGLRAGAATHSFTVN